MSFLLNLLRPAPAASAASRHDWQIERAVKRARVRALLREIAEPAVGTA